MNIFQKSQAEKILSCYMDIEKAKAGIGEIRNWGGVDYKKMADGEWAKVTQTKKGVSEKILAPSTIRKVIEKERQAHFDEYDKVVKEFEESWKNQNSSELWKIQVRVALSRDKEKDPKVKEASEKYKKIYKDLYDEVEEINKKIESDEKRKRELEAGKKEISKEDSYFKENFDAFKTILKQYNTLPDYVNPKEALGNPSIDNYFLNTDAKFKTVYEYNSKDATNNENGEWVDPVEKKWKEMKESGKYEHTYSPKSSSEYLVDRKTGDIYRMADHWGRCASCYWVQEFEHDYGIGVCNIKDFERNDNGSYGNPKKADALIAASHTILGKLKEMVTNDKVYFDKTASIVIRQMVNNISHNLRYSNTKAQEELEKIKKEYEAVLSF